MPKWSKNDAKNGSKIDEKCVKFRNLRFFDFCDTSPVILRFFEVSGVPKSTQNPSNSDTYPQGVILGSPWLHFARFGWPWGSILVVLVPFWLHFTRFGYPFSSILMPLGALLVSFGRSECLLRSIWLVFAPVLAAIYLYLKSWGVGVGKCTFSHSTLLSTKPIQHHNLWLARCGLALQRG